MIFMSGGDQIPVMMIMANFKRDLLLPLYFNAPRSNWTRLWSAAALKPEIQNLELAADALNPQK
jgi:hypothetical protein